MHGFRYDEPQNDGSHVYQERRAREQKFNEVTE